MLRRASRNHIQSSTNLRSITPKRPRSIFPKLTFLISWLKTLCYSAKTLISKMTSYLCRIALKISANTVSNTLVYLRCIHWKQSQKVFSQIGSMFLTKIFKRPFYKLIFCPGKTKTFQTKTQFCHLNFLPWLYKIKNSNKTLFHWKKKSKERSKAQIKLKKIP